MKIWMSGVRPRRVSHRRGAAATIVCGILLAACSERGHDWNVDGGADTGIDAPDVARPDGGRDVPNAYDTGGNHACDAGDASVCRPVAPACGADEVCGNGLDDDCNGEVDESCPCVPGTVQSCFRGPPGRRDVGACRDGTQRCLGSGEFGAWSPCSGGISPSDEVCDQLDNDCDGCLDQGLCCSGELTCPAPGDLRVPDGRPFETYPLRGELFFAGEASAWRWQVRGGPCDEINPVPTFTLSDEHLRDAVFLPSLAGDYTVTLTVVTLGGERLTCTFVVHIAGPGLRVELCYPESETQDLDLYLHDPRNTDPWFTDAPGTVQCRVTDATCCWANCESSLRWSAIPCTSGSGLRADWGYAPSPLSACENGPQGVQWQVLGYCANPRLDIDNNLEMARGRPENINVDRPRDGDRFRIMVQNFSGTLAHPAVDVYCGGHLRGTLGAPPDTVPDFTGLGGSQSIGAMWRVADVVVHTDASGETTDCDVLPLHPPGAASGYDVTREDPSY